MKTKLVLMGTNAEDKKVLVAMQLMVNDNKVKIWTFPESLATPEFEDQLMTDWRNDKEVEFPEGFTLVEKELSVTDNLLPEDIKTDRTDLVMRAQTEWHFIVLSTKMSSMFHSELSDLTEKVSNLTKYDSVVWNDLKGFWGKVQVQLKERNLFREHADTIKDGTNRLFDEMKTLRKVMDEEFKSASKEVSETILTSIKTVEEKVESGGRLNVLFEDLKNIQRQFKEARLSKDDRSTIWDRLDAAFKIVKEKRFGPQSAKDSNPADRISRRLTGLMGAIDKMEKSIQRDKDDLQFQNKRIDRADNQLEAQIRVAKIRMIEERVRSKEEKLADMHATEEQLKKKVESIKARAVKEEAAAQKMAEKKAAIAKEMEANKVKMAGDAEKLEAAAEKIKGAKSKKTGAKVAAAATVVAATANTAEAATEPTTPTEAETSTEEVIDSAEDALEAVSTIVTEGVEDVVDTLKAIASVVGGQIEEAVVNLKKDIEEAVQEVEDKAAAKAAEEEE